MFSRNHWAKEQAALERKEARYLRKRQEEKSSPMQEKISEKIPDLRSNLLRSLSNVQEYYLLDRRFIHGTDKGNANETD